ncbi:MAG TPA: malectin domain-containing carbohydrate-binding protein, partial [Tepidisphaeraceae bacterium]|nr:malectin domain-containing carbohydrate-binding protein [Tepidisphaeraceae bacterium]
TALRLFNSSGTQLAANNDGKAPGEGSSKFSYLEYVFPTAGTYYVGVSLNGNTHYDPKTGASTVNGTGPTGDYRLYLNNLGTTSPTVLRVDAGGGNFTDANGDFFQADTGFTGGAKSTTTYAVANTTDDALFATNRIGSSFSFSKTVANGNYQLTLNFADPSVTAAGQRKFNVFAEGKKILSNFDIVATAGAGKSAVSKTFNVTVNDGKIDLSFAGVVGNAEVSGISLVKV